MTTRTWPCANGATAKLSSRKLSGGPSSRQTTAFGGQGVVSRPIYQAWIFLIPIVLSHFGWQWVWIIAGLGALVTAPILRVCRGSWGRFTLPEVQVLGPAPVTVGSAGLDAGPDPLASGAAS